MCSFVFGGDSGLNPPTIPANPLSSHRIHPWALRFPASDQGRCVGLGVAPRPPQPRSQRARPAPCNGAPQPLSPQTRSLAAALHRYEHPWFWIAPCGAGFEALFFFFFFLRVLIFHPRVPPPLPHLFKLTFSPSCSPSFFLKSQIAFELETKTHLFLGMGFQGEVSLIEASREQFRHQTWSGIAKYIER